MLGAIVSTLVFAFIIGVLARWAVPGPDPMPIWMTTCFGLVGSLIGNGIAFAAFGTAARLRHAFAAWFLSMLTSTLLVIAHRHFIQHRPITGPEAQRPPVSAVRPRIRTSATSSASSPTSHRDGVLTDEEFEAKKAELQGRPWSGSGGVARAARENAARAVSPQSSSRQT